MTASRLNGWAFALLLALFLSPLFLFRFLPSEDGPAHIYNSLVLREWFTGHAGWAQGWLMLNPALPPNVLGHALAAALLTFCPPAIAEKTVIATYIVSFALGFRFALHSVNKNTGGLELLVFPFILSSHLHWGFYNFCLSITLLLWCLGFYLRVQDRLTVRNALSLALLIVMTVLASPVGFGEVLVSLLALELFSNGFVIKRLALLASIYLPGILIYLWFLLHRLPSPDDVIDWPSFKYAAAQLLLLLPLATWSVQFWVARAFVLLDVVLTIVTLRYTRPVRWRFAALALITAELVFVAPASASGGTMITPRLAYMPFFAWTLWFVDNRLQIRYLAPIAAAFALVVVSIEFHFDGTYNQNIRRFLADVPPIPQNSTLWFQTLAPAHAVLLDPSLNGPALSGGAGAYVATRDHLVLLSNYEAQTNHFPLHFKPGKDAFRLISTKFGSHSFLDCSDIPKLSAAGEEPDYVLQWGPSTSGFEFERCGYGVISESRAPERLTLFRKR